MALSVTVTPGITLTNGFTLDELNKLALPTVGVSGSVGASDIAAGAVTAAAAAPGAYFYAAGSLSAGVYAVTLSPAAASYAAGLLLRFKADAANTGAVDVNVNALGAKNLFKTGGQELAAGDIRASQVVEIIYDGTDFYLISPLGQAASPYALTAGTATAYTAAFTPAFTALASLNGVTLRLKLHAANTGAATLAVDGLTAKAVRKAGNQALADGDLQANQIVDLVYDTTLDVFLLTAPTAQPEVYVGQDAGASDTYAITVTPGPAAYFTGMVVCFKANTANTDAGTLNVNSLGAKTLNRFDGSTLATGDISAGQWLLCVYDGTNFRWQASRSILATSSLQAFPASGAAVSFNHGLSAQPWPFGASLRCKTTELGYAVGDEVPLSQCSRVLVDALQLFTVSADTTTIAARRSDGGAFYLLHKSTGVLTAATEANWEIKLYAMKV